MCNWKMMVASYFKLFFRRSKFSFYEYSFRLTWDKNLEGSLPEFRNHHKNPIDIEYNFKLFVISVDFLIMGSAKAILSFIHRLLAAGWLERDGLEDFAAAVEQ